MKNNTEQHSSHAWANVAQSPWMQGPVLGASVMALVTPLQKWTNCSLKGDKMSFRNPMSGALAYSASAVPGYATTFAFKALLQKSPEETSQQYDLLTSFAAGGLSGLVCTPFEALAQNKQLTNNPSSKGTFQKMHHHHGYQAFFQGSASIMLREGLWSTAYMTAIPMMSSALQERGLKKPQAELLALLTVAGTYGLASSPLNQLRFKKQQGLTEPTLGKSYLGHANDIFNQEPEARYTRRVGFFFKACLPRTVTTMVAAGLMVKGTEYYNHTVEYLKK